MAKFTPVVNAEEAYGDGDWRAVLSDALRKSGDMKFYMIGKQSIEHRLEGVILPSQDFTLDLEDQSFPGSVAPCWTDNTEKGNERHRVPSSFALPLMIYPFLGENKEHWLSPRNLTNMIGNDNLDPDVTADAFDDLNKWVRKTDQLTKGEKDGLLKADSKTEDPAVPGRSMRFFTICWCRDKDNAWHPAVVAYTGTAYSYLITQMRWWHHDDTPPRDPNWPKYLLGDPTDPAKALVWRADKVRVDDRDTYDTNVLSYTQRAEFLDPDQEVVQVPDDVLAKRFTLPDPANWNIPTYEEQVDYMVKHYDSAVTTDMIRAACQSRYRGEIPARPENIQIRTKSEGEEEQPARRTSREEEPQGSPVDAVTGGSTGNLAPKSSPPPQPTLAPPPSTPAADEERYWSGPAGTKKPVRRSAAELQSLVNLGQADSFKVQKGDQWVDLLESGLVTAPPAAEEAPPAVPDDTPTAVPDDTPTAVPDAGSDQEGGKDAFRDKLLAPEVLAALPKETATKALEVIDRAWAVTEQGTKRMPSELVDELMSYMEPVG